MVSARQTVASMDLDGLADWMADITPGTSNEMTARAEFLRRQTILTERATDAGIKAAEAATRAADAAVETAHYTRANARYMLWSVIVLAASSLGTFVLALLKH